MKCSINLNSDSTGCFYAGDIVTGNVILELKSKHALKCIDLKITGVCKAQWSRAAPTIPYIKIYSAKIKTLCITMSDIFKDQYIGKSQAGVYQYPFHFALPADLPSTFESSIAKVCYFITVIGKPSCKLKKSVTFNVIGNINLNHIEECLMPFTHSFQKTFRNSGKLLVNVRTYRAFAPKQLIPLEITLNNEKKVKISKINVYLIQKLKYTVESGYADEERKMYKIAKHNLTSDLEESCYFKIEVPQLTPSSLQTKEPMIDISYTLRTEIMFPFHLDINEDIPVTITTAPVIHYEFDQ